jgi:hypothetical protein
MKKKVREGAGRDCPLCSKRLVKGPADGLHIIYCETEITIPHTKDWPPRQRNHYYEDLDNQEITQYVLPYRIVTTTFKIGENQSKVAVMNRYSTGRVYFKTITKCAPLHNDSEENLRKRLKTITVFS